MFEGNSLRVSRLAKVFIILICIYIANTDIKIQTSATLVEQQSIPMYGTIISIDPTPTSTPAPTPTLTPTTTPSPTAPPTTQRVMLGSWGGETAIQTTDVNTWANSWQTDTGKGLAWYAIMSNFGPSSNPQPMIYIDEYKPLVEQGLFKGIIYTWQPSFDWSWDRPNGTCTSQIASGVYDVYIRQEAIRSRNAGYPIIIRFGHEMNGDWAGWGTSAATFKQAWIKVVSIFRSENVYNVKFLWCPNYADTGGRSFQDYYPGDTYVDYVGTDVYANNDWGWWYLPERQIGNINGNVYDTYSNKPYIIGEWGCSSAITETQNADWMTRLFDAVENRSRIVGIVHWQGNQEGWRVDLHPEAFQIYKARTASGMYVTSLFGW